MARARLPSRGLPDDDAPAIDSLSEGLGDGLGAFSGWSGDEARGSVGAEAAEAAGLRGGAPNASAASLARAALMTSRPALIPASSPCATAGVGPSRAARRLSGKRGCVGAWPCTHTHEACVCVCECVRAYMYSPTEREEREERREGRESRGKLETREARDEGSERRGKRDAARRRPRTSLKTAAAAAAWKDSVAWPTFE